MKKLFLFIFLFGSFISRGQTQRTDFQLFNNEGENYKTYVKIENENYTSYSSSHLKSKSVVKIKINSFREGRNFISLLYQYQVVADTFLLQGANNMDDFINLNHPSKIPFKTNEIWTFYTRNDSLFRYDVSETNRNFNDNLPRHNIVSYFIYSDSLILAKNYFLRNTHFKKYSTDSILVNLNPRVLKRYYLRWEKDYLLISRQNDSIHSFSNDSIIYEEMEYQFNVEPFWKTIFYLTGGEGPIYSFEVFEAEEKPLKWKYNHRKQEEFKNEFEFDDKDRVTKIEYFKNQNLYKILKIKYY